jgi:hypothetical protein
VSLDERLAELQDRARGNRTNAVVARNQAFDLAKRIERDVTDLRRKLEHDELEDLDAAISYSGIMTSDAFALERFLVRIVHFVGEGKEGEAYPCGGRIEAHKVVERCGLPREAHSIHPSPVNDRNSPSGHPFVAPIGGDSREAWQDCQMAVVARQDHDGGR